MSPLRRLLRVLERTGGALAALEAAVLVLALYGLVAGALASGLLQNAPPAALPGWRAALLALAGLASAAGVALAVRSLRRGGWAAFDRGRALPLACLGLLLAATWVGTRLYTAVDHLQRAAVLWIAVLGASLATRRREHITIEVFERVLPPGAARVLKAALALAAAAFLAVMAKVSLAFVLDSRVRGEVYFTWYEFDLEFPEWWVKAVLPWGFGLMSLRFLVQVKEAIAGPPSAPLAPEASPRSALPPGSPELVAGRPS